MTILIACLVVLLANLAVLALNLKLYTEVFKEQAQRHRAGLFEPGAPPATEPTNQPR